MIRANQYNKDDTMDVDDVKTGECVVLVGHPDFKS